MTDVRERVSRAICQHCLKPDSTYYDDAPEHSKNVYRAEADAALSAIGYDEIVGALEGFIDFYDGKRPARDKFKIIKNARAALRKARGETL